MDPNFQSRYLDAADQSAERGADPLAEPQAPPAPTLADPDYYTPDGYDGAPDELAAQDPAPVVNRAIPRHAVVDPAAPRTGPQAAARASCDRAKHFRPHLPADADGR